MRVTVVFEDGVILLEGIAKSGFTFTDIDENWRVIQWYGDYGWIEVHNGDRIWLTDIDVVQPFIGLYHAVENNNVNLIE